MTTSIQSLAHGEWFALPSPPRLIRGQAEDANSLKWRGYRGSYDWKSYTAEQLPIMESYWDASVQKLQLLLPERLRADPTQVRGINLGTFNGAFQKAWMRLGYDMYGVEVTDVIDELHEYGCSGEQANFFNLTNISDYQFDFAIMDRALFHKPHHAFFFDDNSRLYHEYGEQMPDGSGSTLRLVKDCNAYIPPFFSEVFRILKPNGVFAAIFYPYWSETAMRELYGFGNVRLHPVQRRHPYLGISVDRKAGQTVFPEIEETARLAVPDKPAQTLEQIAASPIVTRVQVSSNNKIKFHHIPTNKIVTIETNYRKFLGIKKVVNDPNANRFFFRSGNIVKFDAQDSRKNRKKIILSLDRSATGSLGSRNAFVKQARLHGLVVSHTGLDKGSKSLEILWPDFAEILKDCAYGDICDVVLGNAVWDSVINRRSDKSRVSVAKSVEIMRAVAVSALAQGGNVAVLLPPVTNETAEEPIQHQTLVDFRAALGKLVQDLSVTSIDLNEAMSSTEQNTSYASTLKSNTFRRKAASLIGQHLSNR